MIDTKVEDRLGKNPKLLETVEIPGGRCEVYRTDEGWAVHLDAGAQVHRFLPCTTPRQVLHVLLQNLGSGPFAELSWKLVGKVF